MPASRRVLVIGAGGREHALAWKLARDGAEVLCAPGNAGTATVAENVSVAATDVAGLVKLARDRAVDLTVVRGARQIASPRVRIVQHRQVREAADAG